MNTIQKNKKGKIFVLWFQGEKNAPLLVKSCINSIRRNSNGHQVIVLDNDNLTNWIAPLPTLVEKKFKEKIFPVQLKADYIRLALLENYGGLWLDSTIYVDQKIPEDAFTRDFFTVIRKEAYSSDITGKISTFVMGSNHSLKSQKVFSFMRDMLLNYLQNESNLINYLLIENIFDICMQKNEWLADLIQNQQLHKNDILGLSKLLNESYYDVRVKKILNKNIFNKLNYHQIYKLKVNDNTTVYGHLVKDLL